MKHLLVPTRQKANTLILSVLCALFVSPASLAEYTQAQSVALNNNSDEVDYRLVSTKKAMSTSTNLMNQRDFYVGLSRATHDVQVFTNRKGELTKLIEKSTGEKMVALSKEQQKEMIRER